MPRTKLDPKPIGNELIKLIWGEMASRNISVHDLAERTGISKNILYARKNNPEDFTYGEITRICRNLNIPIEQTRAALRY